MALNGHTGESEKIKFVDEAVPVLGAGEYVVEVSVEAAVPDHGGGTYSHQRRLRIAGPHRALAPDDVLSTYPPASGQADYGLRLAYVVLASKGLPWQIDISKGASEKAPWMALLVLSPPEIVPIPDAADVGTREVPVKEYLEPPADTMGPAQGEMAGDWSGFAPGTTCTVVDVDATALAAVMPNYDELPLLVHGREAGTTNQEIGALGDGSCSVVLANRLPWNSGTNVYVAHLVSLEGFTSYVRRTRAPGPGVTKVRLLSLAAWSFNSLPDDADFDGLVRGLSAGPLRVPLDADFDTSTFERKLVAAAHDGGYLGVEYHSRLGEDTVGWYRGPLVPEAPPAERSHHYESVEAALVYDPQLGMFDVSYAVAWQVGRLRALADRKVVVALLAWLRENEAQLHRLVERRARLSADAAAPCQGPLAAAAVTTGERALVSDLVRGYLARDLAPRLAPADPTVPPLLGSPR